MMKLREQKRNTWENISTCAICVHEVFLCVFKSKCEVGSFNDSGMLLMKSMSSTDQFVLLSF